MIWGLRASANCDTIESATNISILFLSVSSFLLNFWLLFSNASTALVDKRLENWNRHVLLSTKISEKWNAKKRPTKMKVRKNIYLFKDAILLEKHINVDYIIVDIAGIGCCSIVFFFFYFSHTFTSSIMISYWMLNSVFVCVWIECVCVLVLDQME